MSRSTLLALLLSLELLAVLPAHSEPYRPKDDAEVLEQLAPGPALKREAGRLVREADSLTEALALANSHIEMSRRAADPRYLGHAEAVLQPWLQDEPAPAALLLRAILRQRRHDFSGALADLDAVLAAEPRNAQALLSKSSIHLVQAEPEEALAACRKLSGKASQLVTAGCVAGALSISGESWRALSLLETALRGARREPSGVLVWAATQAGEIAQRRGEQRDAERWFGYAAAIDPTDLYLLAAYSDFLLETNRPERALQLLMQAPDVDSVLLRRAIAFRALKLREELAAVTSVLLGRFEASARRAESGHLREQALFNLRVQANPPAALEQAQDNWKLQREPADALLLAEAAAAVGHERTLAELRDWIKQHRFEDVRLQALLAK